jgi:hypothetical protein
VREPLHVLDDLAEVLVAQALRELRRLIREAFDVRRNASLILVPQLLSGLPNGIGERGETMNRAVLAPAQAIGCLLTKLVRKCLTTL